MNAPLLNSFKHLSSVADKIFFNN